MRRFHIGLTILALLSALPYALLGGWGLLVRIGGNPFSQFLSGLPTLLGALLSTPLFLAALLFSQMERYAAFSIAALVLGTAALVWLILAERRAALRRARFWALSLALMAVVALPFLVRYEPAVRAAPGRTLRMVEPPGLLEGFVQACQAIAEIRGECQYEPLGWADEETLVYRKWCGGRFIVDLASTTSRWDPGTPSSPLAYFATTGQVAPFEGDVASLHRRACDPSRCVTPGLATPKGFSAPGYFSGHFGEPLLSPSGHRVAFTARHIYGPEDLLVLEGP